MRLALAIITLALTGCNATPDAHHPATDYTVGTERCSKFGWGTSQMAECLDRAAERQSATVPQDSAGAAG
ncbi:hypothetical protein [Bosea sp. ANAM02]|uniref:hypothetical protein n=1 Tax=Bosea sp. ANAM02 TaxID=2020412 RepID=UPI00140EDCCC|nr:hypothetical protein [Bosea sp. ANAM02]BCB18317.1 hypothetical protein OCUBac02_12110 [Bosea sp. ANAM02]